MSRRASVLGTVLATALLVAPLGAGTAQATSPAAMVLSGPQIVYVLEQNGTAIDSSETLIAKSLVTGVITALTPPIEEPCMADPRLSPDGTKVAFIQTLDKCSGPNVLQVLDLTTGTTTTLDSTPSASSHFEWPSWSPDSATVLYTEVTVTLNGYHTSSRLLTAPAVGGTPSPVGGAGTTGFQGVFSPDGTKIAFAPQSVYGANWLAVMDADGSHEVDLTETALSSSPPDEPAWSPDGKHLSFRYFKDAYPVGLTHGVATAAIDGSGIRVLSVTSNLSTDAGKASWSADSTTVFYSSYQRSLTTGDSLTPLTTYATDAATGLRRTTIIPAPGDDSTNFDATYSGPGPSTGSPSTYTAVAPARILPRTTLGPGATLDLRVAGGNSPVPVGATAVTLNLTGVSPTASTFLQVYPKPDAGSAAPLLSNLNLVAGQTAAVAVQVTASADGYVRIRNQAGSTGVVVDVSGYFAAGSSAASYVPIPPVRLLDASIGEQSSRDVVVTGQPALPAGFVPTAVVLNLTGDKATRGTYLAALPAPTGASPVPSVSNLNLAAGGTRANLVTVAIGATGKVRVFNAWGTTRTIVDVVGYYGTGGTGGLAYYAIQPTRVLDTRYGTNTVGGSTAPIGAQQVLSVGLHGTLATSSGIAQVPAVARAYVFTLTAVAPTAPTFLTAYGSPGTTPTPNTSTLNLKAGSIVSNLALTATDAGGLIGIANHAGSTPVIIDLDGYYAP
jgi:WD40-like Beta Propeller Repeat